MPTELNELGFDKPKIIMIISRPDLLDAERHDHKTTDGNIPLFNNSQIKIITPPYKSNERIVAMLDNLNLLTPGNTLLRNPYDHSLYSRVQDAELEFAIAKFVHFTVICNKLGAKSCTISNNKDDELKEVKEQDFRFKYLFKSGKAHQKESLKDKIKQNLKLVTNFTGSAPKISEAEEYIKKHYLTHDTWITSLIELRKNTHSSQEDFNLNLDLTRETDLALNAVLNIKIPTVLGNVIAGCDIAREQRSRLILDIKVEFPI
ncbi:MAG: hypothetical protein PHO08_17990 [Methylococcales bacterium]|nr:hypothetical protein [Methylococcales bacterium]MDD5632008.1 hypothetical protein [Methylococcales bacterium]